MAVTQLLAALLLVVLVANHAEAVKCYLCESTYWEGCADPFNKTDSVSTCDGGVCVKSELKDLVVRGCLVADPGVSVDGVHLCTDDLCNLAAHPNISPALVFLIAPIAAIMFSK